MLFILHQSNEFYNCGHVLMFLAFVNVGILLSCKTRQKEGLLWHWAVIYLAYLSKFILFCLNTYDHHEGKKQNVVNDLKVNSYHTGLELENKFTSYRTESVASVWSNLACFCVLWMSSTREESTSSGCTSTVPSGKGSCHFWSISWEQWIWCLKVLWCKWMKSLAL